MANTHIELLAEPLNPWQRLAAIPSHDQGGAVVSFSGYARATNQREQALTSLFIAHHSPLTERSFELLAAEVHRRFELLGLWLWHRVGEVAVGEAIVVVATQAKHRGAAFEAASFAMDELKHSVMLWKKEQRLEGQWEWVEAKASDQERYRQWTT